ERFRRLVARSDIVGRARLAAAWGALGKPAEARALLDKLGVISAADNPVDQLLLANLYRQVDRLDESRIWLERVVTFLETKPDDPVAKEIAAETCLAALQSAADDEQQLARVVKIAGRYPESALLREVVAGVLELRPPDRPVFDEEIAQVRQSLTAELAREHAV